MHGIQGKSSNGQFKLTQLSNGSPAAKAGLQTGDVIKKIGNGMIDRQLDVERMLLGRSGEPEIPVTFVRNGQTSTTSLVLTRNSQSSASVSRKVWNVMGVRLESVSRQKVQSINKRYRGGLRVVELKPNSLASQHGIRVGDILVGMHKWETISFENMSYILSSSEFVEVQPMKFYILRNGETLFGELYTN